MIAISLEDETETKLKKEGQSNSIQKKKGEAKDKINDKKDKILIKLHFKNCTLHLKLYITLTFIKKQWYTLCTTQ